MKRKLMSVVMALVMVMTLLSGCGSKEESNSTFFKEVQKLSTIESGTSTMEMGVKLDLQQEQIPEQFLSEDGKVDLKIKLESTVETETKQVVKISAKSGENDYQEVTTIAINGSMLYIDVQSIVDFVKTIDESMVGDLEMVLGQMGITGTVSLDIKKLAEATGESFPDMSKVKTESLTLSNEIFDMLNDSFKEIQGTDGDSYTITVNEENADKAVDELISFCDNHLEELYGKILDYCITFYGKDSAIGQQFETIKQDTSDVKDVVKKISGERDTMIRAIKDSKADIAGEVSITGDEGERKAVMNFDTGDITVDSDDLDFTVSVAMNSEVQEGSAQIDALIPENASDLTTLFITYMNQIKNAGIGLGL